MSITHQQALMFRHMGFLRLRAIVEHSHCVELLRWVSTQMEQGNPPCRKDSQGRVVRLDGVFQRSEAIRTVFAGERLLDNLSGLLGPNIELVVNRHNHATVNLSGGATRRLHRDVLQWSRTVVTAILYLEAAECVDGCTEIVPGSHFLPFVERPNNGGTWMDEHPEYGDLTDQAVPVPAQAGDVLVFDSVMFHTIGVNHGSGTRAAITMAYQAVDELGGENNRILVRGERIYKGNDI